MSIATHWNNINKKFSKPLGAVPDVHRSHASYGNLDEIFCWQYKRQLRNDWTIQFKRDYYQVYEDKALKPGDFIMLRRYLDGDLKF